jgi:NADH:ubiquinone oxidoreductase subunit 6 (subunit J)
MLLNLRATEMANKKIYKKEFIYFSSLYLIFIITYLYITITTNTPILSNTNIGEYLSNINVTSFIVFYLVNNPLQLILLTVLLFLAIVAPIAIASRQITKTKKQSLFYAMIRDPNTIKLIK